MKRSLIRIGLCIGVCIPGLGLLSCHVSRTAVHELRQGTLKGPGIVRLIEGPRPACDGPYRGKSVNSDEFNDLVEGRDYIEERSAMEFASASDHEANLEIELSQLEEKDNLTPADEKRQEYLEKEIDRVDARLDKLVKRSPSQINLCGANLKFVKLGSHKILSGMILAESDLRGADLNGADLSSSDLRGARFGLEYNNINNNVLRSESDLTGTDLSGAQLDFVNFELRAGALPIIPRIAAASGLSKMRYESTPSSLVELRDAFKKGGFRQQEREVTCAMRRSESLEHSPVGEALFNYVLFDLTSQWGMAPWRPLKILCLFIFVFSVPYFGALRDSGTAGIWALWPGDGVEKRSELQPKAIKVSADYPGHGTAAKIARALFVTLYFSLISAAQIGWKELNIGSWIYRIQPREFTLKATGWVRVVSGIQALLSVFLIALWALTYFGRPFE
jgi:Pentapeptide repeats (8 copies)